MNQHARVNSIPRLTHLRGSLCKFADVTSLALDEACGDIQRTVMWLRDDCQRYWKAQVWQRNETYVQAKLALKSKKIFDRTLSGSPGSCVDELKVLRIAERKLQQAQHKLKHVNTWIRTLEKKQSDFRGLIKGLTEVISREIPNANAQLDKMIDALEAYMALTPPEPGLSESDRTPLESTTRPPDTEPADQDLTQSSTAHDSGHAAGNSSDDSEPSGDLRRSNT
jgi:hypothetical protein